MNLTFAVVLCLSSVTSSESFSPVMDEARADLVRLKSTGLWPDGLNLRRGSNLADAAACWLASNPRHFYYNKCCCDRTYSKNCWQPPYITHRRCCFYRYGPETTCIKQHHVNHFQFNGLPSVLRFTHLSNVDFASLLIDGKLLTPFHGRRGAPGPKLLVADIGSGPGVDSVVMASLGHQVVALEKDLSAISGLQSNMLLNNVSFPTVVADFTNVDASVNQMLGATNGRPYDLIIANYLLYLPTDIFAKLLDLIAAIAAESFVWLLVCGKEPWDLSDAQQVNRNQAKNRFELTDAFTIVNSGNVFSQNNLIKAMRLCVFQSRHARTWTYKWPRHLSETFRLGDYHWLVENVSRSTPFFVFG